ncbi:MAG: hypothetical protein JWP89_5192 [Schlesneria sp.]|nr:hypothetical protein [Schlesneria sp.]
MQLKELIAIVRVNFADFQAGMQQVGRLTDDFSSKWAKAGNDVGVAIERIVVGVASIAAGIAATTAATGIGFKSMTENAEVMLTTLTGSVQQAKITLADLLRFSKETPFEFNGVRAAAIQFLNAKISANELIPVLRKVGDSVSSIGGGDEALRGVALALSQMMTAGRVNAQDMMQLTNRGIAGWDMLASRMGRSVAEVRKLSESGALDGRESAMLIIDEMGRRAEGASAAMSKKFSGLWSSLKDDFSQFCGQVWEPLYTAMVDVMGRLSKAFNTGASDVVMKQLNEAVSQLVATIMRLIDTHGEKFVENLIALFVWMTQATGQVITTLSGMDRELIACGQAAYQLLAPLMQFLVAHPQLMAAFIALQITGLLGLNQAFLSLGSAIISTITMLMRLPAAFTAVQVASQAATTSMLAFFATPVGLGMLVGLAAVATAWKLISMNIQESIDRAQEAEARIQKLHDKIEQNKQNQHNKKMDDIDRMWNDEKEGSLEQALADAKQKANQAAQQSGVSQKALSDHDTGADVKDVNGWLNRNIRNNIPGLGGDMERPGLASKAEQDKQAFEAAEKREQEVQRRLDEVRKKNAAEAAGAAQGERGPFNPLNGAANAKKLEDSLRDIENKGQQKEDHLPGLDKMRDFLMKDGVGVDHAKRLANAQNGATADDANAFAQQYAGINPKDKAAIDAITASFLQSLKDRTDKATLEGKITKGDTATGAAVTSLKDKGQLTDGEFVKFRQQVGALNDEFRKGSISEQEYKIGLQEVERAARETAQGHKQAAQQIQSAEKQGDAALSAFRTKLFNSVGPAQYQAVSMFSRGLEDLKQRLRSGDLSLEEFRQEVALLGDEAEKAAKKEREARLIRGDFAGAGLNFEDALREKMSGIAEGNFNDYVSNYANWMMGVGNGFMNTMGNVNNGMMQLGGSVGSMGAIFEDAGTQIESGLNALLGPRGPILTPTDPSFMRDPGLQSGGGKSVSINLPNVNRFTNADARQIADIVSEEMNRRGNRSYR